MNCEAGLHEDYKVGYIKIDFIKKSGIKIPPICTITAFAPGKINTLNLHHPLIGRLSSDHMMFLTPWFKNKSPNKNIGTFNCSYSTQK